MKLSDGSINEVFFVVFTASMWKSVHLRSCSAILSKEDNSHCASQETTTAIMPEESEH